MGKLAIRELRAERDLIWDFDSGSPFFVVPGCKEPVQADPFPCYPHSASLVQSELESVAAVFPIEQRVTVWVLRFEDTAHTSAFTEFAAINGREQWSAHIIIAGKRVPPHPAMTRTIVAHEYGHVVARFLAWRRGESDADGLFREYAARWRPETEAGGCYGGGVWHRRIEEIAADDFRILVAKRELEYWPHDGIPQPETVPGLAEFWAEQRSACG